MKASWQLGGPDALENGTADERRDSVASELIELWDERRSSGAKIARRLSLGTDEFYVKASPLKPSAARRHAWRSRLFSIAPPRLAERENLAFLNRVGIPAARPFLAGVFWDRGRPVYQALATLWIPDSTSLAERLESGAFSASEARDLGLLASRLHAHGFVHRDLFARNLILCPERGWTVLDAWRGGTRRGWRGPAWDLACLLAEPGVTIPASHERALLDAYAESGSARTLARLEREKRKVARRYSVKRA